MTDSAKTPPFTLVRDERSYPLVFINGQNLAAKEVLKQFPDFLKAENALKLSQIINHHLYANQYEVIGDLEKFKSAIITRYKSESSNAEFNPNSPRLKDFGMPDVSILSAPQFDGHKLVFFVTSSFLAGFPYRAEVELSGIVIGDGHYSPIQTVDDTGMENNNVTSAPKVSSQVPKSIVYSKGKYDDAIVSVDNQTPFPARDLVKYYPALVNKEHAVTLAEWVFNFEKFNKRNEYFVVVVLDPKDYREQFKKKLAMFKEFASTAVNKTKEDKEKTATLIATYEKLDLSLLSAPAFDGEVLTLWWRDGGDMEKKPNTESGLKSALDNLIRLKRSELVIKNHKVEWMRSEFIDELKHRTEKGDLTVVYEVSNNWPVLKVTKNKQLKTLVSSGQLEDYPELLQQKYAKEVANVINHSARKDEYAVIEDPEKFKTDYLAKLKAEDPKEQFSNTGQLRDFDVPNFTLIKKPTFEGDIFTYYAQRKNLKRPPYRVTVLIKSGKIGEAKYQRLDML